LNKTYNYFLQCNSLHLNLRKTLLLMEDGNKKKNIFYSRVYPFWYHATFSKFTSTSYLFKLTWYSNNGIQFWVEFGIFYKVEIHYKGPILLVEFKQNHPSYVCPFHVNVTICQKFNWSHIYCVSFDIHIWKFSNSSHGSIYPRLS
jgi:hypothetical protein